MLNIDLISNEYTMRLANNRDMLTLTLEGIIVYIILRDRYITFLYFYFLHNRKMIEFYKLVKQK